MGTDNPKVSAYVPQALKDRLKEFREERDNISESQAVTIILAEYFQMPEVLGRSPEGSLVGGVTLARMEALEEKLASLVVPPSSIPSDLLEKLNQLTDSVTSIEERLEIIEHSSLLSRPKIELKEADLLTALQEIEEVISETTLDLEDGGELTDKEGASGRLIDHQVSGNATPEMPEQLDDSVVPSEPTEPNALSNEVEVGTESIKQPLGQETEAEQNTDNGQQTPVQHEVAANNESKPQLSLSSELPGGLLSQPLPGKIMAKRLGYHPDSLSKVKNRSTDEEFIALSIDKDPDDIAWKFVKKGRGYWPVNELSSELQNKLLDWLKENFPEYSL